MAEIINRISKTMLKEMGTGAEHQAHDVRAQEDDEADVKEETKIVGMCAVCQGEIKAKVVTKFASLGPPIIGPSSEQQFQQVIDGYYCTKCGIKYEFVPK